MDSHTYHTDDRKYKNGPDFDRQYIYKSIPLPQAGSDNFELKSFDPDTDVDKYLNKDISLNFSKEHISTCIVILIVILVFIFVILFVIKLGSPNIQSSNFNNLHINLNKT